MPGEPAREEKQQSTTTRPLAEAMPAVNAILSGIQSVDPSLNATQLGALDRLAANAAAGNPYAPAVGAVATDLLAGGTDRTPMVNAAYQQYRDALTPFVRGDYVNPEANPVLQKYLATISDDVSNRVNAQFTGAGRDLSGAHMGAVARGISQGTAPVLFDAYNQALAQQAQAIDKIYASGGQSAQQLAGLDQAALANRQAGVGAATAALEAANDPYNRLLAIEAQRRAIPLDALQRLTGMVVPIAGLGNTSNSTSTTTSTPASNPLQTIVGAGIGAAGLLSGNPMMAMGGFGNAAGGLFGDRSGADPNSYANRLLDTGYYAYGAGGLYPRA
jgi:hypothetical protein